VFPEEVEEACKKFTGVFDCLVVATPDPRFTEKVTAVVAMREDNEMTLGELQEVCRRHIAGYKIPRALVFAKSIVRSPSGKPDYAWAKEYALSQLKT